MNTAADSPLDAPIFMTLWNQSDRRLQILIYPAIAVRSQEADDGQARNFHDGLC
jgi:hypothetical protein